jgi:hypothetical protein
MSHQGMLFKSIISNGGVATTFEAKNWPQMPRIRLIFTDFFCIGIMIRVYQFDL